MNKHATYSDDWYRERLKPPTTKPRLVIDTDAANEIDDQFALAWALLSPDQLQVEAVYAEPFSFAHRRADYPSAPADAAPFNPPADGIALEGLRRGWAHIERATRDGQDREARLNLMSASMQGAMAFQKGLGCVHSLSHSLGGVNPRLHHGTLNAMFLPAVIRFNAEAETVRREDRLARMAQAMGLAAGSDVAEALRDMNARLGLPTGLAAMGVERAQFAQIIQGALADHCHKTNPRIATAEQYEDMLAQSL